MKTLIRVLAASLAAAMVYGAAPARADDDPPAPPKYEAVDANGVDLMSGSVAIGNQPVNSIGDGVGGLTASERVRYGSPVSTQYSYVKLFRDGDLNFSTTVVLLGGTETFDETPAVGAAPNSYTSGEIHVEGDEIVYTQKDGTVARFTKVTLGLNGPSIRTGFLKSVVYPSGEKLTANVIYGGNMQFESNLGYALTGSIYGGRWSPVAANLKQGECSASTGICSGPTFDNQAALGRALVSDSPLGSSTLTVTSPTSGAPRIYTMGDENRVTSFSNGAQTWKYSYSKTIDQRDGSLNPIDGILTTTVTDPLGHSRVVTTRWGKQHILSDTDAAGKTTTFQYSGDTSSSQGYGLLTQITWPEGNKTRYAYDAKYNVIAKWEDPKPGSGLASTEVQAGYSYGAGSVCATSKVCDKPDWIKDARGAQTDFTYDPAHGGVLTVTSPAPASGAVRPQTRYTYGQFTAMYVRDGVMQAAAAPVWRVTQTSTCQTLGPAVGTTPAPCVGTADEVVTSYAYEPSNVANNVRLLSTTTRSGDGALIATTSYAYDDRGDVIAVDGPLPGTADTTRSYYDASRWKTGVIGPDPDGGGGLLYRASRTTYDADGKVTSVETGTATSQADDGMGTFHALQAANTGYDDFGRKTTDSLVVDGVTQALTHYSYDAANRLTCQAARMNPAAFGSPPASACALGTEGSDGPDRITYTEYDAVNRVKKITSGYGVSPQVDKEVVAYTDNGQEQTVADGKGNLTTYEYDGFDRLYRTRYPSPTTAGTSSATDYEEYNYDANGNQLGWRRRDGSIINFGYDALNRKTGMSGAAPAVGYSYDLLGRPTAVWFGAGGGTVTYGHDALGRMTSETTNDKTLSYQYDLAGRRTRITWPDSFGVGYDYDNTGAVTAVNEYATPTSSPVSLVTYVYDDLGRRTETNRSNTAQTRYGYDAASRLSSLTLDLPGAAQDQAWTFAYNAASQVKSRTASNDLYEWPYGQATKSYTVNGLNQYATAAGTALAYDARGNLSNDGTTAYGYDLLNNLTSASGTALAYEPTGGLWSVSPSGGTTTSFLYSGPDLVAEYSGATLLRRYAPGPGTDEPVVWYEGSGTADRRWLLADPQGSIVSLTNGSGAAITTNTYDEYGIPAAGNLGRFQYTGQIWIPEVGLYHYKARAYSPTLGRFLQTDPIGYGDGLNWYAYVGNDPVNGADPTGLVGNDSSMCSSDFSMGSCSTIINNDDGGGGGRTAAVATGVAVGAGVGVAASVTCDGATILACTPANPVIVGGSAIVGGVIGGGLYDTGQMLKPAVEAAGDAAENVIDQIVVQAQVHGNSARSQRPTEVYHLMNRTTGKLDKIGCTCRPGSRYSQAYLNANNVDYVTVWRYNSRYPALVHENIELTAYQARYGRLPRLNRLTR